MRELTKRQRKPLFALVDIQNQAGEQVLFIRMSGTLSDINEEISYLVDDENRQESALRVAPGTVHVWHERGYISTINPDPDVFSFVLLQDAIDYASFMSKPAVIQALIRFWNWMTADMPAFLWGILGAVVIQIIFNLLGL